MQDIISNILSIRTIYQQVPVDNVYNLFNTVHNYNKRSTYLIFRCSRIM